MPALDGAGITVSTANAALTQVPACVPAALSQLATQAAAGVARPDQQALAIEQALAATAAGSPPTPAATPGRAAGGCSIPHRQAGDGRAVRHRLRPHGPRRRPAGPPGGRVHARGVARRAAARWSTEPTPPCGRRSTGPGRLGAPSTRCPRPSSKGAGAGAGAPRRPRSTSSTPGLNQVRHTVADTPGDRRPQRPARPGLATGPPATRASALWWLLPIPCRRRGRRRPHRRPAAGPPPAPARRRTRPGPGGRHHRGVGGGPRRPRPLRRSRLRPPSRPDPDRGHRSSGKAAGDAESPVRSLGSWWTERVRRDRRRRRAAAAWEMSDTAVAVLRRAVPAGLRIRYLATGGPRRGERRGGRPPAERRPRGRGRSAGGTAGGFPAARRSSWPPAAKTRRRPTGDRSPGGRRSDPLAYPSRPAFRRHRPSVGPGRRMAWAAGSPAPAPAAGGAAVAPRMHGGLGRTPGADPGRRSSRWRSSTRRAGR